MLRFYLFGRPSGTVMEWPIDVNKIGSYTAVKVGQEYGYKTDEAGFDYLRSVAKQEQNIQVGHTNYIVDNAGVPIWKQEVVVTETFL